MNSNDIGTTQITDADRAYRGSRFAEVKDAVFKEPYQKPWVAPGQPAMPTYQVTLGKFLTGLFGGPLRIRQATERTVDSHADLRFGTDGTGYRRLLHPNGICLTGLWEITEENPYSGYFKKGSRGLIIGRYSTCCSETRRGHTRSLSLVGKLYPTDDPNHPEPLRTASFFTQQDLGGDYSNFINDAELRNAPDTRVWRRGAGWPILVLSGLVFMRVDKEPTIRQLYEIAELGKPEDEPTCTPKFMRLLVDKEQARIPGEGLDFRDEIMAQIYDKGDSVDQPRRPLKFRIEVTDEGTRSGSAVFQTCEFKNWRPIGTITFKEAAASRAGDEVIHFHHPSWRADRNDPSTAIRQNERKNGAAPRTPPLSTSLPAMNSNRNLFLLVGLVLALITAFVHSAILSWLVIGGSGIAFGILNAGPKFGRATFFGALGLVVATTAILLQPFNPPWLGSIVFWLRVFFAHVLLAVSFVRFLKLTAED